MRRAGVAGAGRLGDPACRRPPPPRAPARRRVALGGVGVDPAHVVAAGAQQRDAPSRRRRARTASASVGDGAGEAVAAAQHDDRRRRSLTSGRRLRRGHRVAASTRRSRARAAAPHAQPVGGRADDVAEHRAGLDRGELLGVADQHQPGVARAPPRAAGPSARATPSRSRRRPRRRAAAGCRGRGGSGCRCRAASRAAGAGWTPAGRAAARASRLEQLERRGLLVHGLLQPGRGLAGRRGQRDQRRRERRRPRPARRAGARIRATVVVLPVPGPPADHGEPPQHGRGGGEPLQVGGGSRRTGGRARRRSSASSTPGTASRLRASELGGDEPLLVASSGRGRATCRRAAAAVAVLAARPAGSRRPASHGVELGPGQGLHVDRHVDVAGGRLPHRGQVDAAPRRAAARAPPGRRPAARSRPPRRAAGRAGARRGRRRRSGRRPR